MGIIQNGASLSGTSLADFLLGATDGDTTLAGAAGNDVIYGDLSAVILRTRLGTGPESAFDLSADAAEWSLAENASITDSTTLAHRTAQLTGDDGYRWFQVTLGAGETFTVDVDGAMDAQFVGFDSQLTLYAADGTTILAEQDDAPTDPGSVNGLDSYMTFTADEAGTYLLRIAQWQSSGNHTPIPAGNSFEVHFSHSGVTVTEEPASGGIFNPDTFGAISGSTSAATAFDLTGDSDLWSLTENPDIQNSTTIPHATVAIQGDGMFQWIRLDMTAGQVLRADVDFAFNGPSSNVDTRLTLFAADGTTQVATHDNVFLVAPDPGSLDRKDALLNFTIGTTGTYYLRVAQSNNTAVPAGHEFLLNVSLTGQAATGAALAGNDLLQGGDGDDVMRGGAGNDTLQGGAGNDDIHGGSGNDIINGGAGRDRIDGGIGDDIIRIQAADQGDDVIGGAGTDRLDLSLRSDGNGVVVNLTTEAMTLVGDGTYLVRTIENVTGTNWDDTLIGNAQANRLLGGSGNDTIEGGAGRDFLDGGTGNDVMRGGRDSDIFIVDAAGDLVFEAAGEGTTDRVRSSVSYTLQAGQEIEFLTIFDATSTTSRNLTGNEFRQQIVGNDGANILTSGTGAPDVLIGRAGNDTYRVHNTGDQVVETATGGSDIVQAAVDYRLGANAHVETLTFMGGFGTAPLSLTGNRFAQTIIGNSAANKLNGMGGADTLTGGNGADTFVFSSAIEAGVFDTITDFVAGVDEIALDNRIYRNVADGALGANAFVANATGVAETTDHRVIYDTATGMVWFDRDGSGSNVAVRVAQLNPGLTLTHDDFVIL